MFQLTVTRTVLGNIFRCRKCVKQEERELCPSTPKENLLILLGKLIRGSPLSSHPSLFNDSPLHALLCIWASSPRKWLLRRGWTSCPSWRQTQFPMSSSIVLPIIDPRSLNWLKEAEECIILEARRLSTNGVMSDYTFISDTIKFHGVRDVHKTSTPLYPGLGEKVLHNICKGLAKEA